MVNVIIGSGIPMGGTATTFSAIVWDGTPKHLIVEMDLKGSCSSFIEISNQPLLLSLMLCIPLILGVAGPQGTQG
jgi:hypothetical protein